MRQLDLPNIMVAYLYPPSIVAAVGIGEVKEELFLATKQKTFLIGDV